MPIMRTVTLPDDTPMPVLGQGTWRMGEGRHSRAQEAAALRAGMDLGLTLIDTAEMYGEGGAEEVVAEAVAGRRDEVFLVSKIYPQNATRAGIPAACERSLARLRTDRLDLYLLHWRGGARLEYVVDGMEALRASGKIAAWGVSNFDAEDMAELVSLPGGAHCASNQVLYNPEARGIEYDLIPWCAGHDMPVMAYSPIGQAGRLLRHPALAAVAARHGATPAQVAIAWSLRLPGVVSIPKASDLDHVRANAAAADIALTEQDEREIDAAFPPPKRPSTLRML